MIIILFIGSGAWGEPNLPHLDLEMTGFEYEALMQNQLKLFGEGTGDRQFEDIFASGKRNLDWIRLLNQNRRDPISLSTAETQIGFPIEEPRIYNPSLIRAEYNRLKQEMPIELRQILFGKDHLPSSLPCTVEEYKLWGLAMDRVYQVAVRWKFNEPYKNSLISRSVNDIRGYYWLTKTPGLVDQLKNWSQIPKNIKSDVQKWLVLVCRNNMGLNAQCERRTQDAIDRDDVYSFFHEHKNAGAKIIDRMMLIPRNGTFQSVSWSSDNEMRVPFKDLFEEDLKNFLIHNLEEEWKLNPFSLKLSFVDSSSYGVEVLWEAGTVPHVPSLGSNIIYMDANAPISEYDVQWTIRHEFGHVLGFPDCYTEFYDTSLEAIVNYQYDTSDLMCSRRGHLKDRHVTELKRVYQ